MDMSGACRKAEASSSRRRGSQPPTAPHSTAARAAAKHFRRVTLQSVQHCSSGEAEHSAVPQIITGCDVFGCLLQRRLFDETPHSLLLKSHAELPRIRYSQIQFPASWAVFRTARSGRRSPSARRGYRLGKAFFVLDQVIGGQHERRFVLFALTGQEHAGGCDRRSRIAP